MGWEGGHLVKVLKGSRPGPRSSTLFVPLSFRLLMTHTEHTNTPLCPALSHIPQLALPFTALWLNGPTPVWHTQTHTHTVKSVPGKIDIPVDINQPLSVTAHRQETRGVSSQELLFWNNYVVDRPKKETGAGVSVIYHANCLVYQMSNGDKCLVVLQK